QLRGPSANHADDSDVGAWYARAAANESGSVHSFRALARELRASRVGARFARRLRQAAREEVRHARSMLREARLRGAAPIRHDFRELTSRSLLEIALENAKEGCVEETWAALVAQFQAVHASDASTRQHFAQIAADETQHAELAWSLHRHLRRELSLTERERLDAQLAAAIDQLQNRAATHHGRRLLSELGLPSSPTEDALRAQLATALRARHGAATRPEVSGSYC
ncbi:MAG TPA: hypothetical protein VMF89_08495, partial [Polyangiales bacterium]|nr:hypothetical protein [Polyangiales bacterium]